ncbi:MAG: LuxR C-terminal-related transcriptional regulator [Roseiflexaceae bacterium]
MAQDAWGAISLILPTKLYGPHPSAGWVERQRLLARLDTHADARLTLIIAAAGFGKTVLVSQWLARLQPPGGARRSGRPQMQRVAWLSLDPADSSPIRFFSAVVAALERAVPGVCPQTRTLLRATEPPPLMVLVEMLVAELAALGQLVWLVLDDLHTIDDPDTHQALVALIDRMPAMLRLIATGRTPPPWPLERWRNGGLLLELGATELCLTPGEVQELIARSFRVSLDEPTVAALHARTEGWAVGVQLAGISLEVAKDPAALATALRGSDRQVMDYLLDEVLARQPDQIQQLLLASAVVERFCTPLCAALLAASGVAIDATVALRHVELHQLFLVPLDREGHWFRYHHLFRELLLNRLRAVWSKQQIQRLYLSAGRWCAGQGLIDEAIGYLLDGNAPEEAARLVETQLHPMLDSGATIRVLSDRLGRIPEQIVQRRPGLLVARAYLHCYVWDVAALPKLLGRAALLLKEPRDLDAATAAALRGDVAALLAFVAYWAGNANRTLAQGRRALELVPEAHRYARGMALIYYSGGLELAGRREDGIRLLADTLARTPPGDTVALTWLLNGLSALCFHKGDLDAAEAAARRLYALIQGTPFETEYITAPHMLGVVAYERNQLDAAEAAFAAVARMRYRASARVALDGLHGLALVALARGDLEAAQTHVAEARAMAELLGSLYYRQIDDAATAWLAWARGERAQALHLIAMARWGPLPLIDFWMVVPQRLRILLLILDAQPEGLAAAEQLIAEGMVGAEQIGYTRRLVELLTLRALAHAAQSNQPAALAALRQALHLAESCGLLRTLVDHGPALLPLLHSLAHETPANLYLQQVLEAYGVRDA